MEKKTNDHAIRCKFQSIKQTKGQMTIELIQIKSHHKERKKNMKYTIFFISKKKCMELRCGISPNALQLGNQTN